MNSFGLSLEFFHVFSSLLGRPRWLVALTQPASPAAGGAAGRPAQRPPLPGGPYLNGAFDEGVLLIVLFCNLLFF